MLKALLLEREHLLESKTIRPSTSDSPTNFFITKFLEGLDWNKLKADVSLLKKRTGLKYNIGFAFRVDKSLQSMLVHSGRTGGRKPIKGEVDLCGRKNCPICKDGGSFKKGQVKIENKVISLASNCGCEVSSVVYLLFCENCSLGYVRATSREVSKRFSEHVGKIKTQAKEIQTVHLHFKNSKKACKPVIGVLEVVKDQDKLLQLEKWYIKKLRPELNVRDATYVKNQDGYELKLE